KGIVNQVDTNNINRQGLVYDVLIRFDIPAAAADVQLDVDLAVTLQREQRMIAINDRDATLILDVARRHGARRAARYAQHDILDTFVEGKRQRLEVADDLMDVFDDARDGLVLVEHAIDAETPDRRATK